MSEHGSAVGDDMRDRLRAAYDAMTEARDRKNFPEWKRRIREDFLGTLRREGHTRLLEIGAGTGRDSAYFATEGLNVVSIDLSPEMVRLCRSKGVEAHIMDVARLRFPVDSFDAVYALNSLLHVPKAEWPGALREVERVLRPGGPFFLGVYGGLDHEGVWEEDNYEPKRFFAFHTDERLLEVVAAVFDVISFDRIPVDARDPRFHFQSLILKKKAADGAGALQEARWVTSC